MNKNLPDADYERQRLSYTVSLAKDRLERARLDNENNNAEILAMKQDMRDNAAHSLTGAATGDDFENLVALSQYVNPIMRKVAEYEATENRIALLEKLIHTPYFARIDFRFDDDGALGTAEQIYIGRSTLKEEQSHVIAVYDWRSPVASMFYRFTKGAAFYDAPVGRISGEICLKRQYEIKDGVLDYYFDADVQIIDEFLRKLLSQNTSPHMKSIVETIQKEQDVVIRDAEHALLMVQGVAGSGKTSIALHRAAWLMYQGLSSKLTAGNIIIISPNALFEQYIAQVLPELGEENVVSAIFEKLLATILRGKQIQSKNQFLEIMMAAPRYQQRMKRSLEFKTSRLFVDILDRFIDDIPRRWVRFEDIHYGGQRIISEETLRKRIASGQSGAPLGLRLKQLERFVMETVRAHHKQRADTAEYVRIKNEVKRFTELDAEELFCRLFDDNHYFYSLTDGLALPDGIDDVLALTRERFSSKTLSYDDASVLALLTVKLNGVSTYKEIRHAVIDEAQDYYPLHYELFRLLFPHAMYTVLGDVNQTLEKQEDMSLYGQIGAMLRIDQAAVVVMDKSFRCTNEILMFSERFIRRPSEIRSFNREGDKPEIHIAVDDASMCNAVVSEAAFCQAAGYRSVGLICKTEKNALSLYARLKDRLDVSVIRKEGAAELQGVLILPVYMAKGLEFDAVLICDADSGNYHSEDDAKLLYIACTRALHRLSLFCAGELSPLVCVAL